jgi:DNA-binding CsgD family transcriptional regulator
VESKQESADSPTGYLELTPAETEVLQLLAVGRTNLQISQALHKQPSTVRHQVSSILSKLGVHTRLEAALITRDYLRTEVPPLTLRPAFGGLRQAPPAALQRRAVGGAERERNARAVAALVTYLRRLGDCLHDEAQVIEEDPERGGQMLRRFRGELLEMSLKDAPVDALLERLVGPEAG